MVHRSPHPKAVTLSGLAPEATRATALKRHRPDKAWGGLVVTEVPLLKHHVPYTDATSLSYHVTASRQSPRSRCDAYTIKAAAPYPADLSTLVTCMRSSLAHASRDRESAPLAPRAQTSQRWQLELMQARTSPNSGPRQRMSCSLLVLSQFAL